MRGFLTGLVWCAVELVCGGSHAYAQGGGREWLEKMSGPGLSGWEVRVPLWCQWDDRRVWYWQREETLNSRRAQTPRLYCIDGAYAALSNSDREDVGLLVSAQRFELALRFPLDHIKEWLGPIEPGVAVGTMGFLDDVSQEWRFTISPRIVLKPLEWLPRTNKHGWASAPQLRIGGTWFIPRVDSDDVGTGVYGPFRHAWLSGLSFVIDVSEVFGMR